MKSLHSGSAARPPEFWVIATDPGGTSNDQNSSAFFYFIGRRGRGSPGAHGLLQWTLGRRTSDPLAIGSGGYSSHECLAHDFGANFRCRLSGSLLDHLWRAIRRRFDELLVHSRSSFLFA